MTAQRRPSHTAIGVGAILVVAGMLAGCTPKDDPEPTPTPTTAFASEEEAFAAAEEVYRAYNEALNSIDPSDPETFEAVFALSSGSFEKADRENLSVMHAEGHQIAGSSRVVSFRGEHASEQFDEVVAIICLDVHDVRISDAEGNSLVSPNRPDAYSISVTFLGRGETFTIDSAERTEDPQCVAP